MVSMGAFLSVLGHGNFYRNAGKEAKSIRDFLIYIVHYEKFRLNNISLTLS